MSCLLSKIWISITFSSYGILSNMPDNDIMVGPGRVLPQEAWLPYTLGITQLDPIRYDLLFERFLNPGEHPCGSRCGFLLRTETEVIDYVRRKYGDD